MEYKPAKATKNKKVVLKQMWKKLGNKRKLGMIICKNIERKWHYINESIIQSAEVKLISENSA